MKEVFNPLLLDKAVQLGYIKQNGYGIYMLTVKGIHELQRLSKLKKSFKFEL